MLTPPVLGTSPVRAEIRRLGRSDEVDCVTALLEDGGVPPDVRAGVQSQAASLVRAIRKRQHYGANVNALLNEYSLSSSEGVMLMCLAEALLRVPDTLTIDRLIRDKLGAGDWRTHLGHSNSLFVNASAWGLLLTGKCIELRQTTGGTPLQQLRQLLGRAGEPAIRAAMQFAMRIMGAQFVLGRDIGEAIDKSRTWQQRGYRYTYDMLGEAARTGDYANDYFDSYCSAIEQVGRAAGSQSPVSGPGFSIKLSALHPRYELAQHGRVRDELAPRVLQLAQLARQHSLGLTIDAEEAHRLDPMLEIFEQVFSDDSLRGWEGFGVAVQSYLKNAPAVIDYLRELAERFNRKIMVRLVKGAYWDAEIKLAQTQGYDNYPVFTRKSSSDLAYIVNAQQLLRSRELLYPQFATHNAHSLAAILHLAGDVRDYEFQRLHGMGEELYDELIDGQGVAASCRIYSPVGVHKDLLAYLVRRLLENGANSSFVHKLADESIPDEKLVEDPAGKLRGLEHLANPGIPLPAGIYGPGRPAAAGVDLADIDNLQQIARDLRPCRERIAATGCPQGTPGALPVPDPWRRDDTLGYYVPATGADMDQRLGSVRAAFAGWSATPVRERADILRRAADLMERDAHELAGFCIREAGKTLRDAIADVREAVDFCRYYAQQAELLQGQGGDSPVPRGVLLCISPWNFPVAIFVGQVSAALVAGNAVLAKPAEQTTLTGLRVTRLLHEAGVPPAVLQVLTGPGEPVGERLLPDPGIAGVMFTGSTAVARYIARTLAERDGERVPLIAETGGQNVMVVDSTALLEKVVDDVIASGFNSAGQRCSALRVLLVQEEIAGSLITMLAGAMAELRIGDPAAPATDVGPIIDGEALARLQRHVAYMESAGRLLYRCALGDETKGGHFFAPVLYELDSLELLPQEVFGPVVHLVRYRADELHTLPASINGTGYGLTFGVHSRIESTVDLLCREVGAGNIYVNRNIIGAVVGVQPFGGRGLSGTGPKAGGPLYLNRLVKNRQPDSLSGPAEHAAPAASGVDWSAVMAGLLEALADWRATPMEERMACIASLEREESAVMQSLVEQGRRLAQPLELTGYTGESNTLQFEARGVIACLIDAGASLESAMPPVAAALLAGNTVLLLCGPGAAQVGQTLRACLGEAGVPEGVIALARDIGEEEVAEFIRGGMIAAVATGGSGYLALLASRALAQRDGPILPLLDDSFGPHYLARFCYEKTVSVNTTASGGNAALMSQGELD